MLKGELSALRTTSSSVDSYLTNEDEIGRIWTLQPTQAASLPKRPSSTATDCLERLPMCKDVLIVALVLETERDRCKSPSEMMRKNVTCGRQRV